MKPARADQSRLPRTAAFAALAGYSAWLVFPMLWVAYSSLKPDDVIFRDTLLRDFGHDPDLLKAQVTRTVRHELAHHLGWNENGVRGLGL